ncbi:hypothetical protein B0H14DRAFT_2352898, partial [Mycena olivaceomarginata]
AFPSKPPPLLSHDVQREDWNKLWDDIDETARIEMRASAGLSVATLPLMPIFGAGFAVSTIAERKLRAGRVGPTCKLIEAWNVNFFRPRHLDVYVSLFNSRIPLLMYNPFVLCFSTATLHKTAPAFPDPRPRRHLARYVRFCSSTLPIPVLPFLEKFYR